MEGEPDDRELAISRAREEVYALLAEALRPPTADRLAALRRVGWSDGLRNPFAALGVSPFLGACASWPGPPASLVEYARIFLGPGPAEAPLYESLYRNPSGQVMGEPAIRALAAYREAGLDPAFEPPELPDHIAVELEFMSALCAAEVEARSAGNHEVTTACIHREAAFLEAHLSRWVPAFCARLRATGVAPYPTIAECLATFVATETEGTTALSAALNEVTG